jgi:hypothetical protein
MIDEVKSLIVKLNVKLENKTLKESLTKLNEDMKSLETEHKTKKEVLEDSIYQIQRKNKQIESEIERLMLLQDKNNNQFNKKNNERIKMSRNIIELEQENEVFEIENEELEVKINRIEDENRILQHPTIDELYYEIVKGFGVEFIIEKDSSNSNDITRDAKSDVTRDVKSDVTRIKAKIMNKSKNDIFTVECTGNVSEVCDKIWECI